MATTTQNYRDTLLSMVESLKPGGDIDVARMAEIDVGGKNLGAQLSGAAVSKGLGNVTMGIPTTVAKQVGSAKLKARSELLQGYLGILSNLASMDFQASEAQKQRDFQAQQNAITQQGPSNASQGLDVFGTPLSGSYAEAQMNYMNRQSQTPSNPSATAQPNLYAAGGYGGNVSSAPNRYGDVGGSTAPASIDYDARWSEIYPAGTEVFTATGGTGYYTGGRTGTVLNENQYVR